MEKSNYGFILDIKSHNDLEAIVTVFLDTGEIKTLRAKGFYKNKSKNFLQIKEFSICQIFYFPNPQNDGWGLLKKGILIKKVNIKEIQELQLFLIFKRLLLLNPPYTKNDYLNFIKTFFLINDKENYLGIILIIFLTFYLRSQNVMPIINKCIFCNSKYNIYSFSLNEGGLICKKCFNKFKYLEFESSELIKIIKLFYYPLLTLDENFDPYEINNLIKMFVDYYDEILGIYLLDALKIN